MHLVQDWAKIDLGMGIPWLSSGYDSVLPLVGIQVQSLVRELRSRKLHSTAKKK